MIAEWAVIGAGPAGIAAVGKLLDAGVPATDITWIDPKFTVGDFGTLWKEVPSNTRVELFIRFLEAATAFNFSNAPNFPLLSAARDKTCPLSLMAEPLQWVTHELQKSVAIRQDQVLHLALKARSWVIHLRQTKPLQAKNVVLAIGSEPKRLSLAGVDEISLPTALNHAALKKAIAGAKTIGVFGASHSAILVLRSLLTQFSVEVINFYRSPLVFATYLKDWILFDDTGLKGDAAVWARENLQGNYPQQLRRYFSDELPIEQYLPLCDKVIYAVGFQRRSLPIEGLMPIDYYPEVGIIAPGLFGFGIAFPEAKMNPLGMTEYRVGLWKFMNYIDRVIPFWMTYGL